MATTKMRGLNEFISDIRACKDRDSETKRIEQEIAKIRERFTNEKGLNSYQRKKYVWKLLYIHILGYEIDFGHFEAANLINSPNYEEKYTGYISSSLLVDEKNDEIWKGLANSIETDIRSRNENAQSLAFSMIGTSAPEVLVNCLSEHIVDAALSQKHSVNIRKKAILCLLRMLRKYPDKFDPKKWLAQLTDMFESKYIVLSFLSSAASLLLGIQAISNPEHFRDIAPKIVRLLHKLVINKECSLDYLYYQTPNPWLQIKLFKILEGWSPVDDKSVLAMIEEILSKILKRTDATKSVNKNNTDYGILFEAVNVVIHYDKRLNPKLMTDVAKILVVFVQSNQANIKYLGLEAMCRLSVKQNLSENLTYILPALVDQDISIRRRALDLLYLISTPNNANQIVKELLGYLETRADPLIKDELVLKIAILAEKFAQNLIWYVDVVVRLVQTAEVENEIWYRILQMITGFGQASPQLQSYAAQKLFVTMQLPHISETMKCIGAYVLSEYCEYLVDAGRDPQKIFDILQKHFAQSTPKSRAMLLNAFTKLGVKYAPLADQVQMICLMSSQHYDPDVQQRGVEFNALLAEDENIRKKILSRNPPYSEEQQISNPLLKRFAKGSTSKPKETPGGKKENSEFETVNVKSNILSSHPLSNHPLFAEAKDRLSSEIENLLPTPPKLELRPYIKQALVKKTPFEGVELKEMYEGGVGKCIITIQVKTAELQFKVFKSTGLEITNSPVKYGEFPQVMLVMTPNGQRIEPPTVGIAWKENGQIVKREIQLPIFVSKFLNGVELPRDKFNDFYSEYSLRNKNYYKLDAFLKTPVEASTVDVMKKIGSFLTSICGMKCAPYPSINNLQLIYGSAMITLKNAETGSNTNYPVLVEVQAYPSDKGYLRVSMRGGHGNTLSGLYQLVSVFFSA